MKTEQVLPVFQSRFLNMMEASFVDEAGNHKKWVFAQRPKNTGVVFVAAVVNDVSKTFKAQPKLVVIREYRVPVGDYVYSIPAGLVDPGETVEEAAERELKEETGLSTKTVLSVTPPLYSSPGMTDEAANLLYVEAEGIISYSQHEVAEDITVFLMDKNDVATLIKDRNLKFDAKAYLVFKHFANQGEKAAMRYKVKSEFIKWLLFSVVVGVMILGIARINYHPTNKPPKKEPVVTVVKDVRYYGAILEKIVNDSKCTCGEEKFNEDKFQRLVKQKISPDFKVTLQRILVNDSTGNYYIWKAAVSNDATEASTTWR